MPSWGRKSNGKFDSFQGLFERKQLRDQALVIGRGAHGVLENLVDLMNDFATVTISPIADGIGGIAKGGHAPELTLELNIH